MLKNSQRQTRFYEASSPQPPGPSGDSCDTHPQKEMAMLGFRWRLALMIFIASTSMVVLADDPPQKPDPAAKLKEIDKQIAAKPDDPLLHAARPQLLAKAGKYDEAYTAAQLAMEKFIAADKELAW